MTVAERIESYLINLSLTYEQVDEQLWVITDDDNTVGSLFVFVDDSLVTVRTKVMELPSARQRELFEDLLRLNLEMVHGAYALEQDHVVLIETLEATGLDLAEFQAVLDAIGLTLAEHYPRLASYREREGGCLWAFLTVSSAW